MKKRPINSAARNAVWSYSRHVPPRFPGAPTITETRRTYDPPDFDQLPADSDVEVQIYGGAITFKLDGWLHRVSVERFRWTRCTDDVSARRTLLELWREVEDLRSPAEVVERAARWYEQRQREEEAAAVSPLDALRRKAF